ncbi:MAG: exodeoxyribonuclease VII small subunit [Epsilonproteobacteria bacterium]|nr:exodeoxyribonuclease VII small subunit [Campylobacterota bacterium]
MEKSKDFEELLNECKEYLNRLMDPQITLQESLKIYEDGLKKINEAQKLLEEAKLKIKIIEKEQSGVGE